MPKANKAADLLKLLGQRTPSVKTESTKTPSAAMVRPAPIRQSSKPKRTPVHTGRPKGARGKAIQFYLHGADEKLIREFAVWLAPHRKRINDSLVIKAVLRNAKTGPGLLAAYDEGLAVSEAYKEAKRRLETQ